MPVMGCVEAQAASVQIFRRFPVALRQTGPAAARCSDVRDVVRAGIVAVEEIKELSEPQNLPTLANFEGTADPHIRLDVGCSTDLLKAFGCLSSPKYNRD
jgi:hypothetical protein